MKTKINSDYFISDNKTFLQIDRIHSWLSHAYWSNGIPLATVQKAIDGAICIGVYDLEQKQVAFARVISDQATFAWISDVIVDPAHRGNGLSKEIVKFILADSRFQGLRRICLATKDAHGLYEQFGFKVTATPGYWMEIKDNEIYSRGQS